MKITDGKRTVDIRIQKWNGSGYEPDFSRDYFNAGLLPYNEETDCYTVEDVDYCIDFASDEKNPESAVVKFDIDGNIVVDHDVKVFVTEVK